MLLPRFLFFCLSFICSSYIGLRPPPLFGFWFLFFGFWFLVPFLVFGIPGVWYDYRRCVDMAVFVCYSAFVVVVVSTLGVAMITNVYTVHDSAVSAFLSPFMARSDDEAIRMLQNTCQSDPRHNFIRHAECYTLYRIARYDDVKGDFENSIPKEFVALMRDIAHPARDYFGEDNSDSSEEVE